MPTNDQKTILHPAIIRAIPGYYFWPETEQERKAAVEYWQANYSDIQQNFDPSVVPLRKKRKIVLVDSTLDGLS